MDAKVFNHNSLFRRIRRRLPFSSYWWLTALFCLSIWSVTVFSLLVWMRPGGPLTATGITLRVLWGLVLFGKILFLCFWWFASKYTSMPQKLRDAFRPWLLSAVCSLLAFFALIFGWMDSAIALIYGSAAISAALTPKRSRKWKTLVTGALNVATAAGFVVRSSQFTLLSAVAVCIVEAIDTAAQYGLLFQPALRRALACRPSRVEFGATALESCPIGGG